MNTEQKQVKMSWEWIAGFFEGEGHIYFQEGKKGTKQGLCGRAIIGQKVKAPLQAIYDFLIEQGFGKPQFYLRPKSKTAERSAPLWMLEICKRDDVIRFFTEILPYLFQKREKAEFVIGRLTKHRDQRDKILQEAFELKKSGLPWKEVCRKLRIGHTSLMNYAKSKGVDLRRPKDRERFDEKKWRDTRVDSGKCRNCGKPRDGESAYKCQACIEAYNEYKREWRKQRREKGLPKV